MNTATARNLDRMPHSDSQTRTAASRLFAWASPLAHLRDLVMIYFVGYPMALIIRLLAPFVLIRVGEIGVSRIGHILPASDLYLCDMAEWQGRRPIDLIYFAGTPVNDAAIRMVRRKIRPTNWARYVAKPLSRLPGGQAHRAPIRYFDSDGIRARVGPTLEPDTRWIKEGDAWLESLGVTKDQPVILIANRDHIHLERIQPGRDWAYHDYRNTDIEKMRPMAEHFAAKGYAVIRMGADVAQPFESTSPLIIDYASHHRTAERDLYLGWRCRFFVGSTSGISELCVIFRKPYGAINATPFMTTMYLGDEPIFYRDGLWLPKLHWSETENRYLTAREIVDLGADRFVSTQQYTDVGITLIENSADDILAFAQEFEARLAGEHAPAPGDDALYDAFWKAVRLDDGPGGRGAIAASFLRNHRELLD